MPSLLHCLRRDSELAKFEAFLSKLGGSNTRAMVRGRQRLAYPIKKWVDDIQPCGGHERPCCVTMALIDILPWGSLAAVCAPGNIPAVLPC